MLSILVIFAILSLLALTGAAFSQDVPVTPNPNPCIGATGIAMFRNDWASCPDYFWCNGIQAIPSGPCPDLFEFNEASQMCTLIVDPCAECPAEGVLLVAVADDTECMTAVACNAGLREATVFTCPEGFRFDRVTG